MNRGISRLLCPQPAWAINHKQFAELRSVASSSCLPPGRGAKVADAPENQDFKNRKSPCNALPVFLSCIMLNISAREKP